jgi:putative ABC transport system permease protein
MLLIAAGIYMLVALGASARALSASAARYYKASRLADAFASVSALPAGALSSLTQIDGVDEVQARLTYDARIVALNAEKLIWLRLISYDKSYPGIPLNAPSVTGFELTGEYDVWIGQSFLDTHQLKTGDELTAIVEGRQIPLHIAGGANSPEYVYAVRDPSDMFPDQEAFGIAYVDIHALSLLLNRQNTFNDISFSFENGYTFDGLKQNLNTALAPYGLISLIARKDLFSYNMVNSEIKNDMAMSYSVPILFAGMASIVLYLMLKRIIEQERPQIGTLKTFGYTNFEILAHYIWYGLITGLLGAIVGILLGGVSVKPMLDLYTRYFTLPDMSTDIPPDLIFIALLVALGFGTLGAYAGARPALRLNPAEAMRPPTPPPVKGDIMKQLPFLQWILTSRGSMALRNILRAKARSAFIMAGVMFSFGMLAAMCPMTTMMGDIILSKYSKVEAYDVKLTLKSPQASAGARQEAMKLPGAAMAEPLREIPAEIRMSNRKKSVILMGLRQDTMLYRLYDDEKHSVSRVPEAGIILNQFTADDLGARRGDAVLISTPYNSEEDEEISVTVKDIIHQNMTAAAYMDVNAVNAMLHLPDTADSVMIKTADLAGLKTAVNDAKNIRTIEDTYSAIANIKQAMGSYTSITWIIVALGSAIAFAIIYNSSAISLSEKKREYATLRVLGMQVGEVCEILNFEYWILFAAGCLLGIPFAAFLQNSINQMMAGYLDNFSMPTGIPLWGLGAAAGGCMAAVLLSNFSAKGKIRTLDMVEVLKERE